MTVRDALHALVRDVPDDVTWAVTASANLSIRGFDVDPADVDVKTDAAGARAVVDAFSDAVVQPLSPPGEDDAGWIRSHHAVLDLAGTPVDVVGDAEVRDDDGWRPAPPVAGNREFLSVDGVPAPVPVMSLDYEREQYRVRGDDERLELLA